MIRFNITALFHRRRTAECPAQKSTHVFICRCGEPTPPWRFSTRTNLLRLPAIAALAVLCTPGQSVEELRLTVGKSIVLDYPADIRQISTSDPAIVDAVAVSTRETLLNPKASGTATVVIWSRDGQRTIYSAIVEQNLEPVRRLIRETFPGQKIEVQS
ncbi:MAG: pilus assembly protein N-terminal domain-containing protein, partial [Bryobacteraceae bacterium]